MATLDQEQTLTEGQNTQQNWQSFTAGLSGELSSIDALLNAFSPPDGVQGNLTIYEGEGVAGTVLHTQSYDYPSQSGNNWFNFALTSPVAVTSGQQYTFQLTGFAGMNYTFANPYPGGTWGGLQNADSAFRTYVDLCAAECTETCDAEQNSCLAACVSTQESCRQACSALPVAEQAGCESACGSEYESCDSQCGNLRMSCAQGCGVPACRPFDQDDDEVTRCLWHVDDGTGQFATNETQECFDFALGSQPVVDARDPAWSVGKFGRALSFTSENETLLSNTDTLELGGEPFSVEFWIKPTGGSGGGEYAQVWTLGAFQFYAAIALNSNSVQVGIGDESSWIQQPSFDALADLDDGAWHYLAFTYDNSILRSYVDGHEIGSAVMDVSIEEASTSFAGGRVSNTFVDGYMDEMRISNEMRSAQEIMEHWERNAYCY